MKLLATNCVPILTYACCVKSFSAHEMSNCNTALNDAVRKVFTFQRWESVRYLRDSFGIKSIYDTFAEARKKFLGNLPNHHNSILRLLHTNLSIE